MIYIRRRIKFFSLLTIVTFETISMKKNKKKWIKKSRKKDETDEPSPQPTRIVVIYAFLDSWREGMEVDDVTSQTTSWGFMRSLGKRGRSKWPYEKPFISVYIENTYSSHKGTDIFAPSYCAF